MSFGDYFLNIFLDYFSVCCEWLSNYIHLPALGIFPIEIESIKSIFLDEFNDIVVETFSGVGVVDEATVLVSERIIPPAKGDRDFDAFLLVGGNAFEETVVNVGPTVVYFQHQIVGVQDGKTVNDVGAHGGIDVIRWVFALSWTVPCPVREVTDDFVSSIRQSYVRIWTWWWWRNVWSPWLLNPRCWGWCRCWSDRSNDLTRSIAYCVVGPIAVILPF